MRPSHVYGPGGWYASELVRRLRQPGRLVVIGSGRNWWDVVHVEDVASACVDAAERAPDGAVYHVADDEPLTQYDFVALTAEALGVGKPRQVPLWLASVVGGGDPARAVVRSARSSNAHLKQELGWAPRFPSARQGVPDAVRAHPRLTVCRSTPASRGEGQRGRRCCGRRTAPRSRDRARGPCAPR